MIVNHGEKCRHCHHNMTMPKPVMDGPRAGQTKSICPNCGHIEYHAAGRSSAYTGQAATAGPRIPSAPATTMTTGVLLRPRVPGPGGK